jgi:hypothetical protein
MKKNRLSSIVLILVLTSCESYKYNGDFETLFKSGSDIRYKYSDFEMYDSSTNILYLKTTHPEFKYERTTPFSLMAEGEEVYQGVFIPPYSSSIPAGPFIISSPSAYPDYLLRIENRMNRNKLDIRDDPRIIAALKEHDLLHSGLSVAINTLVMNSTGISFSFTVTSNDQSDLLFIDPDKTGVSLFHYFTNGLLISDVKDNSVVFENSITPVKPDPWNGWKPEWLSVIKPGESKTFVFSYPLLSSIKSGDYRAYFEFPGFHFQISKEQLNQHNGRIWMGEISTVKNITVK